MVSSQLNVRTSPTLIHELDVMVDNGLFRTRTEAVNEGIRLLIRRYKAMRIADKLDEIAENNLGDKSLTDTLLELREEEDTRWSNM